MSTQDPNTASSANSSANTISDPNPYIMPSPMWSDPNFIINPTWTAPNTTPLTITTTGANSGSIVINSGSSGLTWDTAATMKWHPLIKKTENSKLDILAGFFGQEVHALLLPTDDGMKFVPFIDRFGMILLQNDINGWTAYDRAKFLNFVTNESIITFDEPALTHREVMRLFADPTNNK